MAKDVLSVLNLPPGSIPRTALANVVDGASLGRAKNSGSGAPIELTGAQQGENLLFAFVQTIALSAGTYNNVEIDVRAKIVEIVPTGDVFITGFKLVVGPVAPPGSGGTAPATGNVGGFFRLYKHGFSGRLILYNYNASSAAANEIGTPTTTDYVLEFAGTGVDIQYTPTYSKWQPLAKPQGQLRNATDGSVWVRDLINLIAGAALAISTSDNASLRATNVTLSLRSGIELLSRAGGSTYTLNLLSTTAFVYVDITGAGDVTIDEIVHGTDNVGARVVIARNSGSGKLILKNNAGKGANQITPPGPPPGDYVLSEVLAAVAIHHNSFSWCLASRQNTNETLSVLAAGRVLGLQVDAPASSTPVPLTGAELGEIIRRDTIQQLTNTTGDINVTLNADTTLLLIRSDADTRILSITGGGGREVVIEHDRWSGSGKLSLAHNHGSGTFVKFYLANTVDMDIPHGGAATIRDRAGFWRANEGNTQSIQPGRVRGVQVDGVAGPQQDLTGAEVGELVRFEFVEAFSLVPGASPQTITLDKRTTKAFLVPTTGGDVIIDKIVHGSASLGASVTFVKEGGAGSRILFRDSNTDANSIWTPSSVDFALSRYNDSVQASNTFNLSGSQRWRLHSPVILTGNLAPLSTEGEAVAFRKRVAFSASGAVGTMIDITIWNANAPSAIINSARLRITTAAGGSAAIRTASGGGGSVVFPDPSNTSTTFSFEFPSKNEDASSTEYTIAAGASLYLRIDRAAAGVLTLECVRA